MLLGLSGKKGSGKDTAYGFIKEWAEEQHIPVRRDAFADRLKLSAARIFFPDIELDEAVAWCNKMKEEDHWVMVGTGGTTGTDSEFVYDSCCSGRTFLQRYGTEAHRDVFGHDFWLNPVEDAYIMNQEKLTVITDVRFDNEAELVHFLGGQVWVIDRPGLEDGDTHSSEKPLTGRLVDTTIINNKDLDTFRNRVRLRMELSNL